MSFDSRLKSAELDMLYEAVLSLETIEECYRFFEDLGTIAEMNSLAQRLQVAKMLQDDETYIAIAEKTGAGTATISRVKKCLNYGADGYKIALSRLENKK